MRRVWISVVSCAAFLVALALAAARVGEEPGALSGWQALALGSVQGFTELLPISSSAHLILVPWAADWRFLVENDEFNQTFDVALHLGTLVAVVAYFWRDAVRLLVAWLGSVSRRRVETVDERVAWLVFVATIPAAIAGALGEEAIVEHLGDPWQIAILLAAFAVLLWIADRRVATRRTGDLRIRHAVFVGIAQGLSLMPGVSRSGITITAGRFLGLDRDSAARFSFLLLIPTTLGAIVWKGVGDVLLGDLPPGWKGPFIIGTIAALATGLVAIEALLGYIRRHDYSPFVVYRLLAALAILVVIATGARATTF